MRPHQDVGSLFNNRVWNGGIVITEFLQLFPEVVLGKAVIEFGAATGITGLVASKLGMQSSA